MKTEFYRCALGLLCFVSFGAALGADQVTLKNGDRVSGSILSMDGTKLTIDSAFFGKITLPWDEVETLTTEKPVHVVSGSETLQGTLTVDSGTAQVAGRSIALAEVAAVRDDAAQRSFDRRIAPAWADLWAGELDLGWAGALGNSETLSFTITTRVERPTKTGTTSLFFNAIKASALVEGMSAGTTAQSIGTGWSYDWNVRPQFFVDFFNHYEYDLFQDLDLRFLAGTGLGYKVWKRNPNYFNLVGGIAYTRSYYTTPPTRNAAEAYWGDDVEFRLSAVTSLAQSYRMYNSLTKGGDYRVNFKLGLRNRLSSWLTWNVDLSNRYNNHPLFNRKTNDFTYSTGLGVTFGSSE